MLSERKMRCRTKWNYGVEFIAIPWDGLLSMAGGRAWYACPICGIGITGPINTGKIMVHESCMMDKPGGGHEKTQDKNSLDLL